MTRVLLFVTTIIGAGLFAALGSIGGHSAESKKPNF